MSIKTGRFRRLSRNTLRFKMLFGALSFTVPLIGFLIYTSFYAIDVVRNQVAQSNNNLMSLYMEHLDEELRNVDEYLAGFSGADAGLSDLEYASNEWEKFTAIRRLTNNANSSLVTFPLIDGIFMYSVRQDQYIYSFHFRSTMEERDRIKAHVYREASSDPNAMELYTKGWYVHRDGGEAFLVRLMKMNDSYVGAWLNVKHFKQPLALLGLGEEGKAMLVGDDGAPLMNASFVEEHGIVIKDDLSDYYLTGEQRRFLAVGEPSELGRFRLIAFIPEENILENLPYLRRISTLILLGSVVFVPLLLWLLRRTLLLPLHRLLQTMNRIKQGNLDTRIPAYPTSEEFEIVNDTFNHMMTEIQRLRISVYEEQLNKQKAELQHLQLQLNPHFFINTLNLLHTLARTKQLARIEEMSLKLVHYFRYMFRSNLTFVSLKDEIQHVRNYLRIQELRFPAYFRCDIHAPEFLQRTPVPPLVVQTFVENAMKHAMTLDDPIRLTVSVELAEQGEEPCLLIAVTDTGPGFPEAKLADIRAGRRIVDDEGEHIGIWNVRERLRLLYGSRATIDVGNGPSGGAEVRLLIPVEPDRASAQMA